MDRQKSSGSFCLTNHQRGNFFILCNIFLCRRAPSLSPRNGSDLLFNFVLLPTWNFIPGGFIFSLKTLNQRRCKCREARNVAVGMQENFCDFCRVAATQNFILVSTFGAFVALGGEAQVELKGGARLITGRVLKLGLIEAFYPEIVGQMVTRGSTWQSVCRLLTLISTVPTSAHCTPCCSFFSY